MTRARVPHHPDDLLAQGATLPGPVSRNGTGREPHEVATPVDHPRPSPEDGGKLPAPFGDGRSPRLLRIIVADDDPTMRQFYERVLPALGHQACVARSGRQLVEQCRLLRPDLVISEAKLPDLDGIEAAEEVCRGQPTPIILVAGDDDGETVQRGLANECVLACLHQPIKEADLRAAIVVVMSLFERLQRLNREVADLRQELEDRKIVERAKGVVMRYSGMNEEEAYRRLRKLASVENRKVVEVAQAVLAAGEVFRELERAGQVQKSSDRPARPPRRDRPQRNGGESRLAKRGADRAE